MTFNRYILFRMVVEFVGAIACAIQMFQHHTWPGIITMGVFALVWAVGEIWLSTVYNRAHPRRDELSDEHQATAIRFTFFVLVVALVVLGFADMIVTLFSAVHRSRHGVADVGHAGAGHRRRPIPVARA